MQDVFLDPFGCMAPPPCPVDDTPFTSCTPESVAHKLAHQHVVILGVAEPQRVIIRSATGPAPPVSIEPATFTPGTFTTGTYRGKNPRRPRSATDPSGAAR